MFEHCFAYMNLINVTCVCLVAQRRGDSHHPSVHSERSGVSSLHEEDPQRHQSRQHPAELGGSGQTGRLWSCWTAHSKRKQSATVNAYDVCLMCFKCSVISGLI